VRQRLKLIVFAALSAALTVAGMSIAAGNGSSESSSDKQHRFLPPKAMNFDQDVADVMKQIREAVAKKAPEIGGPVIQKAQDSGDITSDQADKLRAAAQAIADGKRPDLDRSLLRDSDVRNVIRDAAEAARDQTPDIAAPIIQKALDDNKITSAQADQIRDLVKNAPPLGPLPFLGPGRGFGHGGCGPSGLKLDKDVAAVLDDVHQAVDKKQPKTTKQVLAIADPIIDKAVSDKKITEKQASDIRDKLKHGPPFGRGLRFHFRGGPPPLDGPGGPPGLQRRGESGSTPGALPGPTLDVQPEGQAA
jgi:hypothetical protein